MSGSNRRWFISVIWCMLMADPFSIQSHLQQDSSADPQLDQGWRVIERPFACSGYIIFGCLLVLSQAAASLLPASVESCVEHQTGSTWPCWSSSACSWLSLFPSEATSDKIAQGNHSFARDGDLGRPCACAVTRKIKHHVANSCCTMAVLLSLASLGPGSSPQMCSSRWPLQSSSAFSRSYMSTSWASFGKTARRFPSLARDRFAGSLCVCAVTHIIIDCICSWFRKMSVSVSPVPLALGPSYQMSGAKWPFVHVQSFSPTGLYLSFSACSLCVACVSGTGLGSSDVWQQVAFVFFAAQKRHTPSQATRKNSS